jgi:hypothetical protein
MLRVALRKTNKGIDLMRWWAFRRRHRGHRPVLGTPDPSLPLSASNEENVIEVIRQPSVKSLLEVGIGPAPNVERMRLMAQRGIRYVGCDFEEVCESHQRKLRDAGVDTTNVTFLTNRCGTYTWNLMQLLSRGESFDAVYMDGHHTLYVDCPAMVLCDRLLRPAGYYMVDDVCWTLSFMIGHMASEFYAWRFYHRIYDFTEYTTEQMEQPHIGMIAQTLLVDQLGYKRLDRYSSGYWWCLAKPG